MFEILSYSFFTNALLVAFLASILAGVIGTYIVVKRMSLISGSIAHSAFGGLGLAYFLGVNPLFGATFFSVLSALGIGILHSKQRNRLDTLLSFLWATGMAIGLVFLFLTPGYGSDLFTYLFGNILLVSSTDIIFIFVLDILVLLSVLLFFKEIQAVLFDEDFARLQGLPVRALFILIFILISLSVVATLQVVGIVLMIALLTLPAATAQLYTKRLKPMMFLASLLALVATIAGLFISYWLDFTTGPLLILLLAMFFVTSHLIVFLKNKN